jgi:fused signal recognition particle receptor
MGLFEKLKQGLQETAQFLRTDIRDLFKTEGRLVDEAFLAELFEMLVETDMGVEAAQEIVDEIGASFRARVVRPEDVLEHIKRMLKGLSEI